MRSRERADNAKMKTEEVGARIRAREEANTANIYSKEAEARSWEESNIREKAEGAKDAAESKAKRDYEDPEREGS